MILGVLIAVGVFCMALAALTGLLCIIFSGMDPNNNESETNA